MIPVNSIICGDCLEVMRDWPDNCVDLILTSPPYGTLRIYRGYHFYFEDIANSLFRILKDGGVLVWVVGDQVENGNESGVSFKQVLYFKDIGFNLYDTMIYQKDGCPYPNQRRYNQEFEYMFICSKGRPRVFNPLMEKTKWYGTNKGSTYRQKEGDTLRKDVKINEYKIIGNIWKIPVGYMKGSKEPITFEHPATFPEKLAFDHIRSWSNEDDIVLDPMNGSGTTTKMAAKLKRRYIGIDISEKYCEIARQRLEAVDTGVPVKEQKVGQMALFEA